MRRSLGVGAILILGLLTGCSGIRELPEQRDGVMLLGRSPNGVVIVLHERPQKYQSCAGFKKGLDYPIASSMQADSLKK
jgi:hypothetical protein